MFLILVPVLIAAPLVPEADQVQREVASLQGKWKLVRLSVQGRDWFNADDPCDEESHKVSVTIRVRGTMVVSADGDKIEHSAFRILPGSPRSIDVAKVVPAGQAWQVRGEWTPGIYKREGDRLSIATHVSGERPTMIDSTDTHLNIAVYERVR